MFRRLVVFFAIGLLVWLPYVQATAYGQQDQVPSSSNEGQQDEAENDLVTFGAMTAGAGLGIILATYLVGGGEICLF